MTRPPHARHLAEMRASVDTARMEAGDLSVQEWAKRGERRILVAAGVVREEHARDATAELLRTIREETRR